MGVGAQVLFRLNILCKQNDMRLMISLRNYLPGDGISQTGHAE